MKYSSIIVLIFNVSLLWGCEDQYEKVIDSFAGKSKTYPSENFIDYVRLIEIKDKGNKSIRFYGIHEKEQKSVDTSLLKSKIGLRKGITGKKTIQIIGDSAKFSKEGTHKGRALLRRRIDEADLVEYGFTGHKSNDGDELDINSFVNEYIDKEPKVASKVIANIVGHTPVAINMWKTYGSQKVEDYIVVFNDFGMDEVPKYEGAKKVSGFTTFGNDIYISDHLLKSGDGDQFICFEGGVQSFCQIMNALNANIPVTLVYNLRKLEQKVFFSAARFMKKVLDENPQSSSDVNNLFESYKSTLTTIWDENKADHLTKKELFDDAMKRFVDENLYKKMSLLCTFIDIDKS